MPDLRTTYGPNSVRSTGPSMPAGGGGSGGATDDLFERLIRKRLRGLLGGGGGARDEVNVGPNLTRGGRPVYHGGAAGGGGGWGGGGGAGPGTFGGGGSLTRNAKKRDQYETDILKSQMMIARASAAGTPKTYKHIQGGGAYLVDDWDNVPLALRPGTTNLQTGSDVTNRLALSGANDAAFADKMAADRLRGSVYGWGSAPTPYVEEEEKG